MGVALIERQALVSSIVSSSELLLPQVLRYLLLVLTLVRS